MKQKVSNTREDHRGVLVELFKGSFKQCNILKMKKGSVWGGHYHKKTREYFYVLTGELRVAYDSRRKTYGAGDIFVIDPCVVHTIQVVKRATCVVLYSKPFNPHAPDIYKP